MTEKDYLLLLKKQLQSKKEICGFNGFNTSTDNKAVVTTGNPKKYNEGKKVYINQREIDYDDFIISQLCENIKYPR